MKKKFVVIIGCLALLLCCLLIILTIVHGYYDLKTTYKEFPRRHQESTRFIDGMYRYYSANGSWPNPEDPTQSSDPSIPPDWGFDNNPPMISLHGDYHMSLLYYFEPTKKGSVSRKWILDFEGDKTEFDADAEYLPAK